MNNYIVYMHISPSNKRYIGITSLKVERRWGNGHNYKGNKHFTNAINHYGWENFQHIIVARGLTKEEAGWLEIELIKVWDSSNGDKGYNISLGGESGNHSEETRKKISENNAKFWKGKTLSEETRKKLSEAKKGHEVSEETRKKMSEALKGHETSEEARKKMSEAKKGHKPSEETRKKLSENNARARARTVICITTKRIFNTVLEGAEFYGVCISNIVECCQGKRKSAGKLEDGTRLVWRYLTIIEL